MVRGPKSHCCWQKAKAESARNCTSTAVVAPVVVRGSLELFWVPPQAVSRRAVNMSIMVEIVGFWGIVDIGRVLWRVWV